MDFEQLHSNAKPFLDLKNFYPSVFKERCSPLEFNVRVSPFISTESVTESCGYKMSHKSSKSMPETDTRIGSIIEISRYTQTNPVHIYTKRI
ncbi:unnamed protein product [Cylicocyclus nassatus]|uniref:Uncharacterized protein n=1 Tax=Cylicocyclus nassatus TaxID=53992 RepID=A0AA36H195_CYLNA|nr:unnamed protein product [Cylicocyclus nassatus]